MSDFNFDDYDVVIGIDFGTTYSGCSFAFSAAKDDELEDITRWPRQRANFYPKTPTLLLYEQDSHETSWWGQAGHHHFWFGRGHTYMTCITRFKLLLNNDPSVPPLPNGLNVLDVIRDYLKGFHDYICTYMQKTRGARLYDQKRFRYCLTVPAMWNDEAKCIMREAAIRAGIIEATDHPDRLMLTSEPEAAALYCQKHCVEFNLKDGEQFLICDAGGGTVDLVVFEIDGDGPNRRLKEITTGRGGNCGSTFLDYNLKAYLRTKFGAYINLDHIILEEMVKTFIESIKPNFGDDDEEDIYIPLPAALGRVGPTVLQRLNLQDGLFKITYQEMRDYVFEPVIQKILRLIAEQLNKPNSKKPMSAMFMVGGFSQSPYLKARIREAFSNQVVTISSAPRGELAVAKGAVLLGMNPYIVSERVTKFTYGLQLRARFDPDLDPEHFRVVDNGTSFCDKRFDKIGEMNAKIPSNHTVTRKYAIKKNASIKLAIYACETEGVTPRFIVPPDDSFKIINVGQFIIKSPDMSTNRDDEVQHLDVHFYFGTTEIKVVATVNGHSSAFNLKYIGST